MSKRIISITFIISLLSLYQSVKAQNTISKFHVLFNGNKVEASKGIHLSHNGFFSIKIENQSVLDTCKSITLEGRTSVILARGVKSIKKIIFESYEDLQYCDITKMLRKNYQKGDELFFKVQFYRVKENDYFYAEYSFPVFYTRK